MAKEEEKIIDNYIMYYSDKKGRYTAKICKVLDNGKTRARTINDKKNLIKLIEIGKKYNNENPPRKGVVYTNADVITKEFDKYINKKRRFCVLNPISTAMKITRKNATLRKAVVIGSLITVFAMNGLGATKGMPDVEAHDNNPAIVEQIDQDIQSDSIEEIMDSKITEDEKAQIQEKFDNLNADKAAEKAAQEQEQKKNEINQMLRNDTVHFSFENRVGNQSFNNAKRYEATFDKYAKMYGLDKDLLMAMAAQESSGDHYDHLEGGAAIGLMQVERGIWIGHSISAYNFETGQVEKVDITEAKLRDLDTNIKIGAMIQRHELENNNYNIPLSLQAYNMGPGNMNQVLNMCSSIEKIDKEVMRNDPTNNAWWNYRKQNGQGDPLYTEHVFSYVDANMVTVQKRDGSKVRINLVNDTVNNLSK